MQKTKNREPLIELTTAQFAKDVLTNPNRIFNFLTKPDDVHCYFITSVDLFKTQTAIINGGRFFNDTILPCPGAAYAFNITCYDTEFGYADESECLPDIENGLKAFAKLNPIDNDTWYVVDDENISTLETIHHWK